MDKQGSVGMLQKFSGIFFTLCLRKCVLMMRTYSLQTNFPQRSQTTPASTTDDRGSSYFFFGAFSKTQSCMYSTLGLNVQEWKEHNRHCGCFLNTSVSAAMSAAEQRVCLLASWGPSSSVAGRSEETVLPSTSQLDEGEGV